MNDKRSSETLVFALGGIGEVGKNMYSTKDRMFFELVQNADDAASENGVLLKVSTNATFILSS